MGKLIFNAQSTPVAPVGDSKHTMFVDNADGKLKMEDSNGNICELAQKKDTEYAIVDYMLVGGGGGGGGGTYFGGTGSGGGGGGITIKNNETIHNGQYCVIVGQGGEGLCYDVSCKSQVSGFVTYCYSISNGGDSCFNGNIALGGGHGGVHINYYQGRTTGSTLSVLGGNGGSGGGGYGAAGHGCSLLFKPLNIGNDGSAHNQCGTSMCICMYTGGFGGGAGGDNINLAGAYMVPANNAGAYVSNITGENYSYSGGGGGGYQGNTGFCCCCMTCGGEGAGMGSYRFSSYEQLPSTNATNYGAGGGGGWFCTTCTPSEVCSSYIDCCIKGGADGQSGIFILKYPENCGYNITGGDCVYCCNGNKIHIFTQNGTLCIN